MVTDEFVEVDKEASGFSGSIAVIQKDTSLPVPVSSVVEFREQLVKKYYGGQQGLVSALREAGETGITGLLTGLIEQVVKETDHLLGNELVATHNGDLRDASVISFKRAEVLEKAIKAVQTKRDIEKQSGLDIDSPNMEIVFRYFMEKASESLILMGSTAEQKDLFFRAIVDKTGNWKKDLKERLLDAANSVV